MGTLSDSLPYPAASKHGYAGEWRVNSPPARNTCAVPEKATAATSVGTILA
jgi:hypothetical protein